MTLEESIDEQSGAHVAGGVDVRRQQRQIGDVAGEVVIEVGDRNICSQDPLEFVAILVERNVEHSHGVARDRGDSFEKVDVSFDAGYQRAVFGFRQPQLMQRANAIRVAIENVKVSHVVISIGVSGLVRVSVPWLPILVPGRESETVPQRKSE